MQYEGQRGIHVFSRADPVARAISNYRFTCSFGLEDRTLEEARSALAGVEAQGDLLIVAEDLRHPVVVVGFVVERLERRVLLSSTPLDQEDADAIKEKSATLAEASMKLGEAVYKASQEEAAAEAAGPGGERDQRRGERGDQCDLQRDGGGRA